LRAKTTQEIGLLLILGKESPIAVIFRLSISPPTGYRIAWIHLEIPLRD